MPSRPVRRVGVVPEGVHGRLGTGGRPRALTASGPDRVRWRRGCVRRVYVVARGPVCKITLTPVVISGHGPSTCA